MRTGNKYIWLGLILLITLISYWPVLDNSSFVWDDEGYITNNPLVQNFRLKEILTANVMGNYHPVTVLLLAVEYLFFGMDATGYHILHLLLHLVNVLLVYLVAGQLSRKPEVALVAALLFGIHPLHVESVAWLSGLKDLLFTAFFLGSWIVYLKFLAGSKGKYYFLSLLLFLLSLLSKPMAVTLPVVLLLTDFFLERKMSRSVWIEKVPYFLFSVVFGLLAISTQKTSGNLSVPDFTLPQQLSLASYGFISYLIKLVLPFKLSAFYPYPEIHRDAFPAVWYAFPVLLSALALLALYTLRKTKLIFFGSAFFMVNLFLVLQWLPVGKAIMADRYSYLPSVALFFLAAEGLYLLWLKNFKWMAILFLGFFTLLFSLFTFQRSEVWKSDFTLWNDVMSKYENVPVAFLNRGIANAKSGRLKEALEDLSRAIQLDPEYSKAWFNRGNMHFRINLPEKALEDFSKAIELNPGYGQAYYNRGNLYSGLAEYGKAIADYSKAIELDPKDHNPYINRALAYGSLNEYDKALKDFDKADQLRPGNPESHFNRGLLYMNRGEYEKSLRAFSKTLEINPKDTEAFFNKGYLLIAMKRYKEATEDFSMLIVLEPADPRGYYYRGLAWYYSGVTKQAEADLARAAGMGYQPALNFLKMLGEGK